MLANKVDQAAGRCAAVRSRRQSNYLLYINLLTGESVLQFVFRCHPDNGIAIWNFAWISNETDQKMLLRQCGPELRLPARNLPAHTDILTYIRFAGLG